MAVRHARVVNSRSRITCGSPMHGVGRPRGRGRRQHRRAARVRHQHDDRAIALGHGSSDIGVAGDHSARRRRRGDGPSIACGRGGCAHDRIDRGARGVAFGPEPARAVRGRRALRGADHARDRVGRDVHRVPAAGAARPGRGDLGVDRHRGRAPRRRARRRDRDPVHARPRSQPLVPRALGALPAPRGAPRGGKGSQEDVRERRRGGHRAARDQRRRTDRGPPQALARRRRRHRRIDGRRDAATRRRRRLRQCRPGRRVAAHPRRRRRPCSSSSR